MRRIGDCNHRDTRHERTESHAEMPISWKHKLRLPPSPCGARGNSTGVSLSNVRGRLNNGPFLSVIAKPIGFNTFHHDGGFLVDSVFVPPIIPPSDHVTTGASINL
jgi:hypothetical protein